MGPLVQRQTLKVRHALRHEVRHEVRDSTGDNGGMVWALRGINGPGELIARGCIAGGVWGIGITGPGKWRGGAFPALGGASARGVEFPHPARTTKNPGDFSTGVGLGGLGVSGTGYWAGSTSTQRVPRRVIGISWIAGIAHHLAKASA